MLWVLSQAFEPLRRWYEQNRLAGVLGIILILVLILFAAYANGYIRFSKDDDKD